MVFFFLSQSSHVPELLEHFGVVYTALQEFKPTQNKIRLDCRLQRFSILLCCHSCPFRKRSLPFLIKTTRKFFYLLLRVFLLKRKKIAIKPGPRAQTFCILNSLPYLTTLPNQLAKIPKKLSTYTSKLSFRTVTSITGDPSPFHNF